MIQNITDNKKKSTKSKCILAICLIILGILLSLAQKGIIKWFY